MTKEVVEFIKQLLVLPQGKKGVVYICSYIVGEKISKALQCPFYKARAEDKGEILQEWISGSGRWMVATRALGTSINIEGITYVIHVD